MTPKRFSELIHKQVDTCISLLSEKGVEYAPELESDVKTGDRLAHFKQAAALQNIPVEQAAFGMLAKHLASVADMCKAPDWFSLERWREKLTDSINYLLILSAIVNRDQEKQLSMFDENGDLRNQEPTQTVHIVNRVNGLEEDVQIRGGLVV